MRRCKKGVTDISRGGAGSRCRVFEHGIEPTTRGRALTAPGAAAKRRPPKHRPASRPGLDRPPPLSVALPVDVELPALRVRRRSVPGDHLPRHADAHVTLCPGARPIRRSLCAGDRAIHRHRQPPAGGSSVYRSDSSFLFSPRGSANLPLPLLTRPSRPEARRCCVLRWLLCPRQRPCTRRWWKNGPPRAHLLLCMRRDVVLHNELCCRRERLGEYTRRSALTASDT